jgi:hypothetical protein
MVLTAYFALPSDRAFLPLSPVSCGTHPHELDASVEASGPHNFAVRRQLRSSFAASTSTASHRNVRDDRDPPLIYGEMEPA